MLIARPTGLPDWHVRGHALEDFDEELKIVYQSGSIALSPSDARSRIIKAHGIVGEISVAAMKGLDEAIKLAADFISVSPSLAKTPEKILAIAPHSHWGANQVITTIHDPDNECFLTGRNKIYPEHCYYPVAFVFFDGNPYPFEWICGEFAFNEEEIREFWAFIEMVAPFIDSRKQAVGIGFDYRSSIILDSIVSPTIEFNLDCERAVIMSSLAYELSHGREELKLAVSVTWPLMAESLRQRVESPAAQIMNQISN
jgi:hypothetical protein